MMLSLIILIIISVFLSKLGLKLVPPLLREGKLVAKNYRGEEIPVGYGLYFTLTLLIILIIGVLLGYYQLGQVYRLIILILIMALVGILDDTLGDKINQGFSGHFKALILHKRLTTGAIKAIFSFFIILFINLYWYQIWLNIFINTVLILLTTNFINLLDLRPGRALKATLISLIIILLLSFKNYLLIVPVIVIVLLSLPFDLKAEGMMGDVGANVLGVIVGFLLSSNFGLYTRIIIMLSLIIVHIYTEFYSLSELIKKNKVLLYLDRIGRRN